MWRPEAPLKASRRWACCTSSPKEAETTLVLGGDESEAYGLMQGWRAQAEVCGHLVQDAVRRSSNAESGNDLGGKGQQGSFK